MLAGGESLRALGARAGDVKTDLPDGDFAAFVEKAAGPQEGGEIVHEDGRVLGLHRGIHHFTVGQRKGLNIAQGVPLYVRRIEAETKRVIVASDPLGDRSSFRLLKPHWVHGQTPVDRSLIIKIRSRHQGAAGRINIDERGLVTATLDSPARAVTPGQAAVVYDGDEVLGGGWII